MLLISLIFFPMLGALVAYLIGCKNKKARNIAVNVVTIAEFVIALTTVIMGLKQGNGSIGIAASIPGFCGIGINLVMDGFRAVYALVTTFMWMMVTLLSPEYFEKYRNRNRFYFFLLVTLGATVGVFLSRDFYTTFIFFEVMSLASYVWVAHDEKKDSMRAAETYLGISILGGMVMLMGIFILAGEMGTVAFSELRQGLVLKSVATGSLPKSLYAAGWCIVFGFAVKAGAFPVHIWLPKAHPVAPAPASALLSGVLTKTGIFGITVATMVVFYDYRPFANIMLMVAVCTMVIGAVLAIFSTNLKKVLACSSLSQIGFILTGVFVFALAKQGNANAARGAFIYMVNHSILKLVLFMSAGVIYMNIHKLEMDDIKGFGRKKPLLNAVFLLGVVGIAGVPFFNGYVGKTLIHEAIVEVSRVPKYVEPLYLFSGGCTLCYMLKLYICIFLEKNNNPEKQQAFDEKTNYWTLPSKIALVGSAILIPIIGMVPNITADRICDLGQSFYGISGELHKVHYFEFHNMKGSLISMGIGVVLYIGIVRYTLLKKNDDNTFSYVDYWPKWLDLENILYRPVLLKILPAIFGFVCRVLDSLVDWIVVGLKKTIYTERKLPHEIYDGNIVTDTTAKILRPFVKLLNATFCKKKPIRLELEHTLALKNEEFNENIWIITRSLSYGLMIFSFGLVLTVVYLLWLVF